MFVKSLKGPHKHTAILECAAHPVVDVLQHLGTLSHSLQNRVICFSYIVPHFLVIVIEALYILPTHTLFTSIYFLVSLYVCPLCLIVIFIIYVSYLSTMNINIMMYLSHVYYTLQNVKSSTKITKTIKMSQKKVMVSNYYCIVFHVSLFLSFYLLYLYVLLYVQAT